MRKPIVSAPARLRPDCRRCERSKLRPYGDGRAWWCAYIGAWLIDLRNGTAQARWCCYYDERVKGSSPDDDG